MCDFGNMKPLPRKDNYKLKSEQTDRRLQLVAPKPLHVPTPKPGVVDFSGALEVTNTGEVFRNVASLQKRATRVRNNVKKKQ